MLEINSPDGTVLGVEVVGDGPAVLLVHGGTADRTRWAPLLPLLREQCALHLLDRRGRGASAREAAGYALARESEDVLAVVDAIHPAGVFAHSYGATVTLNALDRMPDDLGVVLYEPPFPTGGHVITDGGLLDRWQEMLDAGDRIGILESFYQDVLGFDATALAQVKALPAWPGRVAAAHTLIREGRALTAFEMPPLRRPQTRVLVGDQTTPALAASSHAAAGQLGTEPVVLAGHGHVAIDADPPLIARHIREVCLALSAD